MSAENPTFKTDASNTAAQQEVQIGMHYEGIYFFPQKGSTFCLLMMNHEYSDDSFLQPDGMTTWTARGMHKAQAVHGVSMIEVGQKGRPKADGQTVALGASHYLQYANVVRRSGCRPCDAMPCDAKACRRQRRHASARRADQLRQWHHALGRSPYV